MKIAVVGCGAIGTFYGARLCQQGQDVHFLLRSDYDVVRQQGVTIHSYQGDFSVRPHCACRPEEIGVCDWVLIGLKSTANHRIPFLLPPLVGPNTAVLTLQNGLGNEAAIAGVVPPPQILGGMCFVCLNRVAPGVIRHLDHGRIVIGEFQRPPAPRTHAFASLFQSAGVPCDVAEDLERAHWEKLAWNVPFNGLGVAAVAGYDAVLRGHVDPERPLGPCLPTDALLADSRWLALLEALIREVVQAAGGKGHVLSDHLVEVQIRRTQSMGAYKASTLLDYERGLPLELEGMFLEPLRQAQAAGVATPCLQNLCRILQQLDGSPTPPSS